jgi:hypothetical protein
MNQQSIKDFKAALSKFQMPIYNKVLVQRIGTDKAMTAFKEIKKFFGQNAGVESIQITPDIKFDRSDILGKGLSGLAWYIKTGRLVTNFEDIVAPLVSVGNAGYFAESVEQPMDKVPVVD